MKSLSQYINESLQLDKIKDTINELQDLASKKKLTVKFRNRKMNSGDFCIFIYSDRKKSYEVGFDGYWDSKDNNFDSCVQQAKDWIENYK